MPEKWESPDPVLTEEAADQEESERRAVVGCSGLLQQLTDQQLAEGGLEKEEGGSEQDQKRGCFALAEERWEDPERGGPVGPVCQPTQQQEQQALMGRRLAGQTSRSRSRCPVEGWECWERSCGCPDRYLWCHCCHRPEHCGFLKSSPPLPQPLPPSGSPAHPVSSAF